jgi:hypothetical protein
MFFETFKPNPVPVSDFVSNFSKSRGNISLSIPFPLCNSKIKLEKL